MNNESIVQIVFFYFNDSNEESDYDIVYLQLMEDVLCIKIDVVLEEH